MANHIKNDLGDIVAAIGADGSEARVTRQYPKLLSELDETNYYELLKCLPIMDAASILAVKNLTLDASNRLNDLEAKRCDYVNSGLDPEYWDEYNWLNSVI